MQEINPQEKPFMQKLPKYGIVIWKTTSSLSQMNNNKEGF